MFGSRRCFNGGAFPRLRTRGGGVPKTRGGGVPRRLGKLACVAAFKAQQRSSEIDQGFLRGPSRHPPPQTVWCFPKAQNPRFHDQPRSHSGQGQAQWPRSLSFQSRTVHVETIRCLAAFAGLPPGGELCATVVVGLRLPHGLDLLRSRDHQSAPRPLRRRLKGAFRCGRRGAQPPWSR